jgi:ABC-type sugar transport system permease subunit
VSKPASAEFGNPVADALTASPRRRVHGPQRLGAYALVAPSLLVLVGVMIYPIAYGVYISLFEFRMTQSLNWVSGIGQLSAVVLPDTGFSQLHLRDLPVHAADDHRGVGYWTQFGLLLARMLPPIVFVVPLFLLYNALGLRNSLPGLAPVYAAFNVPFVVWLMRSFFEEVPIELEEAVMIDGGSRAHSFWHVTLPLAAPGLAATSAFCAMAASGEFLFALILTGPETSTLPIYLASFIADRTIEWGGVTSTGVLVILPLVCFGMLVQRHLIKGLTRGAMKG